VSSSPIPNSRTRAAVSSTPWPRTVPEVGPASSLDEELSLADYVRLMRRWWWLAALVWSVVLVGVALTTMLQAPTYTSSATVLIRTSSSAQLFPLGGDEIEGRTMAAEADFLASSRFLLEASVAAGNDDPVDIDPGDVDARVAPSVITFTAASATAERAAATAQAWAETYIAMRHDIDVADSSSTIASLEATTSALTEERNRVASPIADLDAQLRRTEDAATIADLSAQRVALVQTLNAQLEPIDSQLAATSTSLAELRLTADLLANPEVSARINADALVPESPSSPQPVRNMALGTVVGGILAVAAVVAISSFDDRLRTTDDAERASGLGALATVPYHRDRSLPIEVPAGSVMEESFQRIVSAIDFAAAAGRSHKVLLVTSPQPGEGKTTTTARLATALAAEGRNVLVIGGDLRRPSLSLSLGADQGPGLADLLTDPDLGVESCMHRVAARHHLVIMPAGKLRDDRNPAEALRSPELAAMIERMREFCDHILIDSPPLLPVVDGLELAEVSDAVILVLSSRKSRGRSVQRALRLLDEAGTIDVLGYVLNAVPTPDGTYEARY